MTNINLREKLRQHETRRDALLTIMEQSAPGQDHDQIGQEILEENQAIFRLQNSEHHQPEKVHA